MADRWPPAWAFWTGLALLVAGLWIVLAENRRAGAYVVTAAMCLRTLPPALYTIATGSGDAVRVLLSPLTEAL